MKKGRLLNLAAAVDVKVFSDATVRDAVVLLVRAIETMLFEYIELVKRRRLLSRRPPPDAYSIIHACGEAVESPRLVSLDTWLD